MKKIFSNKLGLSGKKGLGGLSGGSSVGLGASSSIDGNSGHVNPPQASASTSTSASMSMAMAGGGGGGSNKMDLACDESTRSGRSDVSIGSLPRKNPSSPSFNIPKSERDSLCSYSPLLVECFSSAVDFECIRLACLRSFKSIL